MRCSPLGIGLMPLLEHVSTVSTTLFCGFDVPGKTVTIVKQPTWGTLEPALDSAGVPDLLDESSRIIRVGSDIDLLLC